MANNRTVLVTGGAGYVGAVLVPKLLNAGFNVKVLDLYLYGREVFDGVRGDTQLQEITGDLRDPIIVQKAVHGCDAVIHLACISNDPSFELNSALGKSINFDAFEPLVDASRESGVRRFIYASSSSVYGIKAEAEVSEGMTLEPLTDYSKFKALCEDVLLAKKTRGFEVLVLRPATVCGYSPRLRLDLSVNILTNHAVNKGVIRVFGGTQLRPNLHISDMADAYVQALDWPSEKIDGRVFNVGYQNYSIMSIAEKVRGVVGHHVRIDTAPTDDLRSYHISSKLIERELGFTPKHTVEDAISDLVTAFRAGRIPNANDDDRYYNIRRMQNVSLV